MDFELSDEQSELQRAARALLADLSGRADAEAGFDEAWYEVAAQGWLGVPAPEELGGLGLSWVEGCVLLEQLGWFASPLPVAPAMLAIDAAVAAADAEAVDALVGGSPCAFVVSTGRSPLRPESAGVEWWISGETAPVLHLPHAQHLLCVAGAEDDRGLFLVAVGDEVGVEAVPGVDPTRSLGRATLKRASARRLGGSASVARVVDRASFAASADMLGTARRALELATTYAQDRVQFGRPIGSFQAVKHRLADMLVDVEAMHSLTYWAAWCLSNAPEEARIAAATARSCARECTPRVMAGALQVHGGIGFTWEHDLHRFIKRAALDGLPIGGHSHYEADLSRLLVEAYRAGDEVI